MLRSTVAYATVMLRAGRGALRHPSLLPVLQQRHLVIQRRYLLGPLFRVARSGFALAAGAAAGSAAYMNHKFDEATGSASDRINDAKEWMGEIWNHWQDNLNSSDTIGPLEQGSSNQGGGGSHGASEPQPPPSGRDTTPAVSMAIEDKEGKDDDEGDDQDKEGENSMINLTKQMIEIRNILTQIESIDTVQLPSIVVIGSQSGGKSSVLEALVGHEFLPKGSNMVTRRPIELTLVHTPGSASEFCEFPTLKLNRLTDFGMVRRTLTNLNLSISEEQVVSDEPIQLRIYSPNVPDLTMIDLPGYIQVVAADQPLELKSRISQLCEKYIKPPNVILAVSAADVDLANSAALRASRRVDPKGERTIGVITKMDLVDQERGAEILMNREYPLRMGYVGVITRATGHPSNLTQQVAHAEKKFFGTDFQGMDVGVLKLRSKLMWVLEKSMAASLAPTTRALRKELEETAYEFKVEYNDRVLTPQTYLAQAADALKIRFQQMSNEFGRDEVKELVKRDLDQRVLNLLAERYWNAPYGADPNNVDLTDLGGSKPDVYLWETKLDSVSSSLTKLGIGRLSSSLLSQAVHDQIDAILMKTPFVDYSPAINTIRDATDDLLQSKLFVTADQIESAVKPYKYEVEIDPREWIKSREYTYNLMKEELRQCEAAIAALKQSIGSGALSRLLRALPDHADGFSDSMVEKGLSAKFLNERAELLRMRISFLRSSKCKTPGNKALCPEIFLNGVADKLTATAVLFLNFELLSDFYYSFPRALDARLQALTDTEVEALATQNPRVKRHIELQRRRELLSLALAKLQALTDMRQITRS